MGIKELVKKGLIKVWEDVYDARLDDKAAPDLSDILRGEEEPVYSDPEEFFRRTYMTGSMEELIEEVSETLKSERGGRIFLLTSLFGGGKTHTHICLYHAFHSPEKLSAVREGLSAKVAEAGKPLIIVMDGSRAGLVPHPDEPYKAEGFTIQTIWGMLAYRLGAYARIRHLDNERAPAPETDLIKAILSEARGPVLILMDEIVHYVFNMYKSRLRDYGEKVLLFLDFLARAVEGSSRIALVASVQAEYRMVEGQQTLVEEDVFRGYAGKILTLLTRQSTRIIVPVSPEDVVRVLQRRIFERLPEREAWEARDRLYGIYRQNPELFGVESDWQFSPGEAGRIATAKDTYPFHPKYVEALQEFVTRNRDLQKTRDAVRISRKVVRRFLRGREDSAFIMPWHIDLRDGDIRGRVLTESRREFRDVADRDLVSEEGRLGSVRECSKPSLALRIGTAVLLKTYTYETFKEPLRVFPDLKSVALMVFEPETFSTEGLQPPDIATALQEMHGKLPHFESEEGRYWFTPFPSVIEHVEKRAEELLREPRLRLYEILARRAKEILLRRTGRRREASEQGEIFGERNTIVIGFGEEVWMDKVQTLRDEPSLKLVVLVKPDVSDDEVRRIILMRGEGGRRTFRNTVAVVCPPKEANFEALLAFAAKVKAAEEVMESLSEYYTDREIRGLQERKLKSYIQTHENLMDQNLLATLTRVAYPSRSPYGDDIRWVSTVPSSSIISQVEAGLRDSSTGPKLRTDFGFRDLAEFLKRNLNWDLIEGVERKEFREVLSAFYSITSSPFTTRNAVEQAILEGVGSLEIGIEVEGALYWKRIGPEDGAERPPLPLKESAELLPYRLAAERLKARLLAETGERREGKEVRLIWYEVELAGRRIRLEDLILQQGWEKAMKEGAILRMERVVERGFILKVLPATIRVKPGSPVEASVIVEPIEDYAQEVQLLASSGSLSLTRGRPSFEAKWSLGILEPGDHSFTVEGMDSEGTVATARLSVIVESPEEELNVEKLDPTHTGAMLLGIFPRDLLSLRLALDAASRLKLKAEADVEMAFGEGISFSGRAMEVALAGIFVQKFSDIQRLLPSLGFQVIGSLRLLEPVVLDASKITALASLSGRATFRLRVRRYG